MSLGERIRKARDAKGLKQSELADLIDVKSSGVISNWEKDINKPDADKIIKLCEVLDISASFLLDYYGNTVKVSFEEQEMIKKYRILDEYGKDMVATVLDKEFWRCSNNNIIAVRSAARSNDGSVAAGVTTITEEQLQKMQNAPTIKDL